MGARVVEPGLGPSRFARYPAYKDSGIEWLGEIPTHWGVVRLRRLLTHLEQGWSPECENREADDGEWAVLKAGCVNRGVFVDSEHKALPLALDPVRELEIRRGDLLMSRASGSRDLVGSVAMVTSCRPRLLLCDKVFRLGINDRDADRQFLAHAINSAATRWQIEGVLSGGSGLANNIPQDVVKDLIVARPPEHEQRAIATFLDRETVKIDALVATKERLIELLQEKRTALITRAVTKGLDPDVPMKDSGVEWLGDTPAHWEVKRIKFIAQVGNGSTPSRDNAEYWGGEYPWLNSGVVNLPEVTEGADFVTELALRECHLPRVSPPAVLVGITGEGRTRGMATVMRIEATINQHLAFIRPIRLVGDVEYIRYVLCAAYQFLRDESGGGGSTKGALTCDQIGNMSIPFPPRMEQRALAAFLDRETARIAALIAKVRTAIDRLTELRTALITAAVTGKIDVREQVA